MTTWILFLNGINQLLQGLVPDHSSMQQDLLILIVEFGNRVTPTEIRI